MDLNKKKLAEDIKKLMPEASTISVNFEKKSSITSKYNGFSNFCFFSCNRIKTSYKQSFNAFFANSAYENYVGMDIVSIGEKLNISERSVINAINELEKNKIIIRTKHPSDKRRNDYFLNPFTSWKGNAESRKK